MVATIRRPPPAPIWKVSAIAVRRTIDLNRCDPGDVIFIDESN